MKHMNAPPVNRKILFLAYYFPPLGMGGTQRVAKWSKYLSRAGWEVTVVTVKPIIYYAQDESLLEELRGVIVLISQDAQRQPAGARAGGTGGEAEAGSGAADSSSGASGSSSAGGKKGDDDIIDADIAN